MTKSYRYLVLIIAIVVIAVVGCSNKENGIAYISTNEESEYVNTFKDLGLGILYDFDFKLPRANKSWVTLWVEGYRNGEKIEPFHLTELSYGMSPNEVDEGQLGFGIINPNGKDSFVFLYAPGVKSQPQMVTDNIFTDKEASGWDYAIGDEEMELKSGETKVLGVYRQVENGHRTFGALDTGAIDQMIKQDGTVLLLKIKVEERNEDEV